MALKILFLVACVLATCTEQHQALSLAAQGEAMEPPEDKSQDLNPGLNEGCSCNEKWRGVLNRGCPCKQANKYVRSQTSRSEAVKMYVKEDRKKNHGAQNLRKKKHRKKSNSKHPISTPI
ncbi:hypothetical protein AAFF_G00125800 [Aldrovandia affinis]|uniref:Secreted protein n=1 Tax=Aldrovandia affinis TaxID=143900 RepID=A0AAD7RR32_9TELE|nr:hypothetical protein AAFF_G00125800 [Aldrovandia affinis]